METKILSNGQLRHQPTYPYFCQRFQTDNEIYVNLPLTIEVDHFVFDVQRVIEINAQANGTLATRLRNQLGELRYYVSFTQNLLAKLAAAYTFEKQAKRDGDPNRQQATSLNAEEAFVQAFFDLLQVEDWRDITRRNEDMSRDENVDDDTLPNDYMDYEVLARQLWTVATRYSLTDLHKTQLFVDTLNRADAFIHAHFTSDAFSWESVSDLIIELNSVYLDISLGTTSQAVAERFMQLVDASTNANRAGAFAQYLITVMNRQAAPAIPVPYSTFDAAIREALEWPVTYAITGMATEVPNSEDTRFSSTIRDFYHYGQLSYYIFNEIDNNFRDYVDLFFSMLSVKGGHACALGSRQSMSFPRLADLANFLTATRPQLSLHYPWANDMSGQPAVAEREERIFSELYLNALLHRVGQQLPSVTASRFLSLLEDKRMLREEPQSSAIKHVIEALGTAYDAFVDVCGQVRSIIFDDQAQFARDTRRISKYREFLSQYLALFGRAVEGLDSPRFMYSIASCAVDSEAFASMTPEFTLGDVDLKSRANLVIEPSDFSYFKYYVNAQLSNKLFELPIPKGMDLRLLRSPFACSLSHHYFVRRSVTYSLTPSENLEMLLSLSSYGDLVDTGFEKYLRQFGEAEVIGNSREFLAVVGLPIEEFAGIFEDSVLQAIQSSQQVVFFKWNSNNIQHVNIEDVFKFYEYEEYSDIYGNPAPFLSLWPFLVKCEIPGVSLPLQTTTNFLEQVLNDNQQQRTEPGRAVKTGEGVGIATEEAPVVATENPAEVQDPDQNAEQK